MGRSCVLILLLMLASTASAAVLYNQWNGLAGTSDWNTAGNWAGGYVPVMVRPDGNNVKAGFKTATGPIITSSTIPGPEAWQITLGGGTGGFLTINSGTLRVGEFITMGANTNEYGTFYINGGTISTGQMSTNAHLFVGQKGPGSLVYMTGGTVNLGATGNLRIADQIGSSGTLYLDGGIINANDLLMPFAAAESLNISYGTLILNGNDEAAVNALIDVGKITTSIPGGTVLAAYDPDSGKTNVWAIPEPATVCLLGFGLLGILGRRKK